MTLDKLNPKIGPIPSDKLLDTLEGRKAAPKATSEEVGSQYDRYVAFQMAPPVVLTPEEEQAVKVIKKLLAGIDMDAADAQKQIEERLKTRGYLIKATGLYANDKMKTFIDNAISWLGQGGADEKKISTQLEKFNKDRDVDKLSGGDEGLKGIKKEELKELIKKFGPYRSKVFDYTDQTGAKRKGIFAFDPEKGKTFLIHWEKEAGKDETDVTAVKVNNDQALEDLLKNTGFTKIFQGKDSNDKLLSHYVYDVVTDLGQSRKDEIEKGLGIFYIGKYTGNKKEFDAAFGKIQRIGGLALYEKFAKSVNDSLNKLADQFILRGRNLSKDLEGLKSAEVKAEDPATGSYAPIEELIK